MGIIRPHILPNGFMNPRQWWPDGYRPRMAVYKTYFVYFPELRRIKIGRASDVAKRFTALRRGVPGPLHLMAVLDGDYEERLHDQFRHARVIGEWFHAYPSLVEYIRVLNRSCPVEPVSVDEAKLIEAARAASARDRDNEVYRRIRAYRVKRSHGRCAAFKNHHAATLTKAEVRP